MPYSRVSFRVTLIDLEWLTIQLHEASHGLSATAELLVLFFLVVNRFMPPQSRLFGSIMFTAAEHIIVLSALAITSWSKEKHHYDLLKVFLVGSFVKVFCIHSTHGTQKNQSVRPLPHTHTYIYSPKVGCQKSYSRSLTLATVKNINKI